MTLATQYDRVLDALEANEEVCGHRTFYGSMMIPRFSAHLTRARKNGYVITKRPCDLEDHDHEGTGWLYRLEALPAPPIKERVPTGDRDSQLFADHSVDPVSGLNSKGLPT